MKRDLGFFDAHESSLRCAVPGDLEERQEHAERPQSPIRHVAREEPPGMLRTPNLLPELERLSRSDGSSVHSRDSRNDLPEVRLDPLLEIGRSNREVGQHAGGVAAVPLQQLAG